MTISSSNIIIFIFKILMFLIYTTTTSEMFIISGNGYGCQSSKILDEAVCISHNANNLA